MRVTTLALFLLYGCGDTQTTLYVEVDLSAFLVPSQVNLIHLEMEAEGDKLGRNFPLEEGEDSPLFELVVGPRTPRSFYLVGHAYLDAWVAQSAPTAVTIEEGETQTVLITILDSQ